MTEDGFIDYWSKEYPEVFPINHELRWAYPDRWFRIHSLPESKRYANSESEYKIILDRQNTLMEDVIGDGTEIAVCFLLYINDITNDSYYKLTNFRSFRKVLTIDLREAGPEEYEDHTCFDVFVKVDRWQKNDYDEILKAVADDEISVMFVCPSNRCIIAPYDGGVDVIVDSTEKRDQFETKYRDWLPQW